MRKKIFDLLFLTISKFVFAMKTLLDAARYIIKNTLGINIDCPDGYFWCLISLVEYFWYTFYTLKENQRIYIGIGGKRQPKYVRCTHNVDFDKDFDKLLGEHSDCLKNVSNDFCCNNNYRVIIGNNENPINLGTARTTIEIPMVFHLLDPALNIQNGVNKWSKHINDNIIPILQQDYNRNFDSYQATYIETVEKLFEQADPTKKEHYLNKVNSLPVIKNIEWKFTLRKIIIKPTSGLFIASDSNDRVFRAANLEDPNSYLNIIIAPSKQILGISVFPFSDRDPIDTSKISKVYTYRNAILIGTTIFKGTSAPYNTYRTFTHEIGHWCGLLHPFDNISGTTDEIVKLGLNKLVFDRTPQKDENQNFSGDLIADTDPQVSPTYGTVYDSFRTVIRFIGQQRIIQRIRNTPYAYIFEKNENKPNFFNFMDYTDDKQMCMFTNLQIMKMVYMLGRFRPNFVKSD